MLFRRLFATKPWSFDEASRWIANFSKDMIPKDHVRIHFSRSSGPGGQNVNKVSTKVDMRLVVNEETTTWLPSYARDKLKLNKSNELVVTSDRTRSQPKNIQDCYDKLVDTLKSAVAVPREPDQATLNRVASM